MTTNDQVTALCERVEDAERNALEDYRTICKLREALKDMLMVATETLGCGKQHAIDGARAALAATEREATQPAGVESRLKYAIAALMQIYRGWPTPDKFAKEALDFINDPGNWPSDAAPERSGKAADEKPIAWAVQDENRKIVYWSSNKERVEIQKRRTRLKNCQFVEIYTRPAGNSSAAPSDEQIHELMSQTVNCDYHQGIAFARAVIAFAAPAPTGESLSADDLRQLGLTVAVHNDYRLNGEHHTFWLFTDAAGMSYKGEGKTDAEALAGVRAMLAAAKESA